MSVIREQGAHEQGARSARESRGERILKSPHFPHFPHHAPRTTLS
ncbi:hypothetical protein [Chroococcidiopsis sp.]